MSSVACSVLTGGFGPAAGRQPGVATREGSRPRCEMRESRARARDEARTDEDPSGFVPPDERGDGNGERPEGDDVRDLPEARTQHPVHPDADGTGRVRE